MMKSCKWGNSLLKDAGPGGATFQLRPPTVLLGGCPRSRPLPTVPVEPPSGKLERPEDSQSCGTLCTRGFGDKFWHDRTGSGAVAPRFVTTQARGGIVCKTQRWPGTVTGGDCGPGMAAAKGGWVLLWPLGRKCWIWGVRLVDWFLKGDREEGV